MGMAFPLFVLMACESDPHGQYQKGGPTDAQKLTNSAFSLQVLECLVHTHTVVCLWLSGNMQLLHLLKYYALLQLAYLA